VIWQSNNLPKAMIIKSDCGRENKQIRTIRKRTISLKENRNRAG
jgi:hypothetical protein